MRLSSRIRAALAAASLTLLSAPPALAGGGIAISFENMFVPLGKKVEKVYDGNTQQNTTTPPPAAGTAVVQPGRETSEWIGLGGFFDLNRNWRLLGSAHATLLNARPLFKFDTSLALMLPLPDTVPVQPYLFIGATPVISAVPEIPTFGLNLHSGLGVDWIWNNRLYAHARLNLYMLSIYGETANKEQLNLHWLPASFSLSAGMGWMF